MSSSVNLGWVLKECRASHSDRECFILNWRVGGVEEGTFTDVLKGEQYLRKKKNDSHAAVDEEGAV